LYLMENRPPVCPMYLIAIKAGKFVCSG